jgi:hydroxymethylpyrimidine pyrophosphatase-like HAD family hydrolase/fructoselysine-6-P-deglycase FrlB-like protein
LGDRPQRWLQFCGAPLVAIGSGGSYSAAALAVYLHEQFTGQPAKAVTPLEATLSTLNWPGTSALVLTARGGNPDVLGAFRHLAFSEPSRLGTLCTRLDSPLNLLAREFAATESFDFDLPSGKDGFLATNSLLATAVVLARLYQEALNALPVLPASFDELLSGKPPSMVNGTGDQLWKSETLIALYSPCTRAAAIDLESKFCEAAIGNLQTVDYRNFAHGRHNWLARRGASTGIIAFIADEVADLAHKTLKLIPAKIPTLVVSVGKEGPPAAIAALVHAIRLLGAAGQVAGFDPGRPHVPAFGRSIYHLNAFGKRAKASFTLESTAIARKSGSTINALEARQELDVWKKLYADFVMSLRKARFGGVVLDYDGTLCDEAHRFDGLTDCVAKHLSRLARSGVVIGIATGRGKSVRTSLQDAIPKKMWKQFIVGYYNGGDIGDLEDNAHPNGAEAVDDALKTIAHAIKADPFISSVAELEFRLPQITVQPKSKANAEITWQSTQQLVHQLNVPGVMMLRSSHSMDIVAPFVNKQAVVECVRQRLGAAKDILCIGDRGNWPGNDFALLNNPYSLSVDEVSPDPLRCWNLAPASRRGAVGTIYYFEQLSAIKGVVKFSPAKQARKMPKRRGRR